MVRVLRLSLCAGIVVWVGLPAVTQAYSSVDGFAVGSNVFASATASGATPKQSSVSYGDPDWVKAPSSSYSAAATRSGTEYRDVDGILVPWNSSGTSSSFATAGAGVLHVYATAHAKVDPISFSYYGGDGPVYVGTPAAAGATASAEALFHDTITVTSATLPPGTPVDLRTTVTLHDTATGTPGASVDAQARLYVGHPVGGLMLNPDTTLFGYPDYPYAYIDDNIDSQGRHTNSPNYPTAVVHTFVGDELYFEMDATAQVSVQANMDRGEMTGTADAGNTVFFNLDPITVGAGYASASGASYVTPVPEPAGIGMAIAGVGALGARRRLRVRQVR